MKKNLLHVVTNVSEGGLEKNVLTIISNLNSNNFNYYLAVLTNQENRFLYNEFLKLNVKIKQFDFDNRLFSYRSIPKNIVQLFKFTSFIRKQRIDILHSHDFFPSFVSRISAIICFLLFFYRVNKIYLTLNVVLFWLKPIHHSINRFLSIFTTKVICVSKSVYNHSLKHDRINKKKYVIIYNGVNINNFIPDDSLRSFYIKEFGFDEENYIIGNVGVVSVRKGQKYLINAFIKLKKYYPNIRLIIFGSKREHELPIKNEIYSTILSNDLEQYIRIIEQRDVTKIYNMFDVFVMPSITEGLSLSAIEAMLMQRICLFSDIGPFKELVTDGVNGFLFKNKDEKDLEEKLNFILSNYATLDYIKQEASRSVKHKFDARKMAFQYEELYLS